MSRRNKRRSRSRSRDSWRRSHGHSSYGSYSSSRSLTRSRRGPSRDRRSKSRSRFRSSDYKSNSTFSRYRRRQSEAHNSVGSRASHWKSTSDAPPHASSQNRFRGFRNKRSSAHHGVWHGSNKYESEEFKSQRMEKIAAINQQRDAVQNEKRKLQKELADLTTQLNHLVSQLALLPKEAPERGEIGQKIRDVKFAMRQLQAGNIAKPNKLDYRETKLLFKQLPDCAKGPGKLAEWIANNAAILLPKQIAMLASTADGAVIQYHSHNAAEMVMGSCKLHGIAVCWASSALGLVDGAKNGNTEDVDYNLL